MDNTHTYNIILITENVLHNVKVVKINLYGCQILKIKQEYVKAIKHAHLCIILYIMKMIQENVFIMISQKIYNAHNIDTLIHTLMKTIIHIIAVKWITAHMKFHIMLINM